MAVSHKVWRFLCYGLFAAMLGFVAACGDDEGAIPQPGDGGTGAISGQVTDATTGNPIVGATVGTTPATAIALTDGSGNYTISNVAPGSYAVTASKDGFTPASATTTVAANATATVNLQLTPAGPGGVTTGTVTGLVRRANGQPVPEGTTVQIFRDASTCGDTPTASPVTDAGGRYLQDGLEAGAYLACVEVTIGGQTFTGRTGFVINSGTITQADITVGREADQTTDPNVGGAPIELDANGQFDGIIRFVDIDEDGDAFQDCNVIFSQHLWVVEVIQDLDDDGVVDEGEPLVSGARVEWSLNQAGGGVAVTDPTTGDVVFIQGTTGVIVDTDDPFLDPVQAEAAKRAASNGITPQFKVDNTHAVTYTNDTDQTVDFNGESVTVGVGRTWIIVSSPVEGFTDVLAFSPDLTRDTQCGTDPDDGTPTCPEKDFAIKRWVNWRIEVAELTEDPEAQPETEIALFADILADGDTVTNRLDREPFCEAAPEAAARGPRLQGLVPCTLNNTAFIGVVISRLRLDSPFTFTGGHVEFQITDDNPDTDILDIDSDTNEGIQAPLNPYGGGDPSADDVETPPDDDNFAADTFSLDSEVIFECEEEAEPGGPPFVFTDECVDVDVDANPPSSAGQFLTDMGFTITPGAELTEGAVAITIALDEVTFAAFVDPTSPTGFTFTEELQDLIAGVGDLESAFQVRILDQFGEVCEEIDITKRWVSSILQIFKDGPETVALGDTFDYTVTIVNAGEDLATDVIMADTLPILDDTLNLSPDPPFDRDGNQAFQYVTDDPTFDPDGIRYYIDEDDDAGGTTTDFCFEAPSPVPAAFDTPESDALCVTKVALPTIAEARDSAEARSSGDLDNDGVFEPDEGEFQSQVVIVEYFDEDILARTPSPEESEDSFEITLLAIHSVNEFRVDGTIPERDEENGEWCNIATVISAENDFAADSVCTRVVEALLEVRKTVRDAIVPGGSQVTFDIDIGNNGSDDLVNVTVTDTLDPELDFVMEESESLCEGCTITFNADSTIFTILVPTVPPTDDDGDGVFDDDEGFRVVTIIATAPLAEGQFCNRVTVTAEGVSGSDTDLACVIVEVDIEFDVVNNDGLRTAAGEFNDVDVFSVGDTVAYETSITNRSNVTATNVDVTWNIAADDGILQLIQIDTLAFDVADPADITCDTSGGPTGSGQCTVTVDSLPPLAAIILNYRTIAETDGNDVNQILLTANELNGLVVVNEEPTTVNP